MKTTRLPSVLALANAFSTLVRAEFSTAQLIQVIRRNKAYAPNVCATHDFTDANLIMARAWEDLTGQPIDLQSEDACRAWGDAWEMAKAAEFLPIPEPIFRCSCTWAEGTQDLPLSHFEDVLGPHAGFQCPDHAKTLSLLRCAAVGDKITSEEPFNGTETFVRIS